jgi:hypothetical protein
MHHIRCARPTSEYSVPGGLRPDPPIAAASSPYARNGSNDMGAMWSDQVLIAVWP